MRAVFVVEFEVPSPDALCEMAAQVGRLTERASPGDLVVKAAWKQLSEAMREAAADARRSPL